MTGAEGDMSDPVNDLRATSDAVLNDAERLTELETKKRSLDPADPEVDRLSREIEELARRLSHKATAERELSEEIKGPEAN